MLFWISDSDSVYFLYMGTYLNDLFQHFSTKNEEFSRSVNNSRTNYLGGLFGIFDPEWSLTSLNIPRKGTFDNFWPGGDVCQQMDKHVISNNNSYHKYMKGSVCQFWGPHNVGKRTIFGKHVYTWVLTFFTHECWPPQTSLDSFGIKKVKNLRQQISPMRLHWRYMPLIC